jgi:hypothetical protein
LIPGDEPIYSLSDEHFWIHYDDDHDDALRRALIVSKMSMRIEAAR